MTQDKILKELPKKFVTNDTDYMKAFRHNVLLYLSEEGITIHDLAEWSGLSADTLKSFLYKGLKDCKLSTAVALAKALGVSVDELVGAGTLSEMTRESVSLCRTLPEHALHLIRWHIRHQDFLYNQVHTDRICVSVMNVACNYNGTLELTNEYEPLDITDLDSSITFKVFFGMKLSCDYYMPVYSRYDILLVANDREPTIHENVVLTYNGVLAIARRRQENGVIHYYSIRDGKFRMCHSDRIEVVGYVAAVCRR